MEHLGINGTPPQTSTWTQAILGPPTLRRDLMALRSCTDHEPQHSLRWLHMPSTSAWFPKAAKPEALESCTNCKRPHRSQASLWSGAAAWTTDTNIASGGILDHVGSLRRSGMWTIPHLGPPSLLRAKGPWATRQVLGLSLQLHKLQTGTPSR